MTLTVLLGTITALLTAIGGILATILSHRKNMMEMQLNENNLLRKALSEQIDRSIREIARGNEIVMWLHDKIDKLTADLDIWKNNYYELNEAKGKEIFDLRTELQNKFLITPAAPILASTAQEHRETLLK